MWDFSYHPERDTRPGEAAKQQAIAINAAVGDTDTAERPAQTLYDYPSAHRPPPGLPVHFRAASGCGHLRWRVGPADDSTARLKRCGDYGRYIARMDIVGRTHG